MNRTDRMSEYIHKKNRGTTWRLIKYFAVSPGKTAWAIALSLALNAAAIATPLVIRTIIDDYIRQDIFDTHIFVGLGALYMLISVFANGTGYAQALVLRSLGQQILHKIRVDLFGHIQTMSMKFFDDNSSGSILTRVTSDVETLSELYTNIFIMFIRETILVIGILVTMFALDPVMALWCLSAVPIVVACTFIYRIIARRNFIKIKAVLSRINGYLAEHIIGMRIVQIFNMEKKKFDDFDEMNDRYYKLGLIEVILHGLSNPLVTMISNLMAAILIAVFHESVTGGILQIGTLFAFTTYVRQLFEPIAQLAEQLTTAQSALISADRIFDIMDNAAETEDLTAGESVGEITGSIEFKNVWFAYSGENWVLKDVSFKIEPGTHAAFIGSTGCGKTTVMSLISRFYEIQKGQILIDGRDSREYNLHSLRRGIAVVMQDVFLFTGDIRYNIRLNEQDIKNKDVEEAARIANCHDFILSLPGGYMHGVAERGSDFSLGQRQLISFARAVAAKPSVLILDEATASIDSDTERALQEGLENYTGGKTLLVIAHRISTIVNSDVIFVMDKGEIRERGRHAELMEIDGGIYKKLYTLSQTQK